MQLTEKDYQLLSKIERIVNGTPNDDSEKPKTKEQQAKLLTKLNNELSCGLFAALRKKAELDRLSILISGSYDYHELDQIVAELEKGTPFDEISVGVEDELILWARVEDSFSTPEELLEAIQY